MIRRKELKLIKSLKETNGGYVYVLLANDSTVKIGVTINPYKRISQIETASGKEIVDWFISQPCLNYIDIENNLHNHFAKARLKGEWFDIKYNDAVKKLNAIKYEPIDYYDIDDEIINVIKTIRLCNVFTEVEHSEYNYEKVRYNITYEIPDDAILEVKNMILEHYNANVSEGEDTDHLEEYILNINNDTNIPETVVDYCLDYISCMDLDTLKEFGLYDLFNKVLNFEITVCNILAEDMTKKILGDLYEKYGKEIVEKVIKENFLNNV